MITRLTSRHKSTIRAPHGPASTGFPSVRSKMLQNEDVRGDTFFDNQNQQFSYSQYVTENLANATQNN